MKNIQVPAILLAVLAIAFLSSCRKAETTTEPYRLTVDMARLDRPAGTYYSLPCTERSLELDFSEAIDSATLPGAISIAGPEKLADSLFSVSCYGRKVFIAFHSGFILKEGWQYLLTVTTALRSVTGSALKATTVLELRTTTLHPGLGGQERNSIVCISDIHMGDPRASAKGYAWFGENAAALDSLLTMVRQSPRVRQLVILGDLFDGWVIPYRINPLDPAAGISSVDDYFRAVAASPVNAGIIASLQAIAAGGVTQLIYVPGNHDMLLTPELLQELIPGILRAGDAPGLGHYTPSPGIIMEHGHRYDFFNAPQPLAIPGHILPPGFFVSRLDAQGLMDKGKHPGSLKEANGSAEFLTAWTAAITYLEVSYSMTVAPDSANILTGGMDGFAGPLSFNGIRDQYAAAIETAWPETQVVNNVPVAMPAFMAIVNGSSDMGAAADYEYILPGVPTPCSVVVFGHTHQAMIRQYPSTADPAGIYANTGTWVNRELTSHPVRTFVEVIPGAWSGSALDVVSVYQYNRAATGDDYEPALLEQASVKTPHR